MAQDKGKNIITEPLGGLHGCHGDGCASEPDTWPLHRVIRRGVHCRLCSSCILLSHRSLYCCRCFFLVTTPSCDYDDADMLMAPPAPTVTCQVCHEAVAHLPCLYYPVPPADDVFVCPACTAAQKGKPFTYAPSCRRQLSECGARVLILASRMALALLKRHATAARVAAERLDREAQEAQKRAQEVVKVAYDLGMPQSPQNDLAASEEEGNEDEANMGKVLLVQRNEMPSLPMLTIGTGGNVVPMALAEAQETPPSAQSKPLSDLNENAIKNGLNDNAAENEAEAVQGEPTPHRALNSFNVNGVKKKEVALNSFNMKGLAMAATEAARASTPTPQTLPLFPSTKASSSTKMPCTKKPRTKRQRTLQLFNDDRA